MTENMEIITMLGLGVAAGVLSGLFGIGGGLVIVPALVVVFGFPIKTAVGTSLFALLLPTGLLGVLEYWRTGNLRPAAGLCIALGLFFGAYLGAVTTAGPNGLARWVGDFDGYSVWRSQRDRIGVADSQDE